MEYTWIYKKRKTTDINRKGKPDMEKVTIIINIIDNSKINNFINKFKRIKGLWNIKNIEKWNQIDVKVLEIILKRLKPNNFILIDKYKTAVVV